MDGAPAFRLAVPQASRVLRRHRVCGDENKLPSSAEEGVRGWCGEYGSQPAAQPPPGPLLTKERNRQEHDHVWANLPTLSLAGIGETNETRETHETQNIRLVFWGLQRKHEEYCEVGVGLALPLTLFQVTEGKTWVAHTCRFAACVRPPAIECRRAWSPSSHGWRIPRPVGVCGLRL